MAGRVNQNQRLPLAVGVLVLLVLILLVMAAKPPAFDKTKIAVEDITITSNQNRGFSQIIGRIVNTDSHRRSLNLKMLFYSHDGGVIGRARGTINGLRAGEARTFRIFTGNDIGGYTRYSLEISEAP